MKSYRKSIYQISLSALFLALSVIFAAISKYVIPLLHFPNGGSISLVMMFLALANLTLGPLYGLFVSVTFALINLVFDGGFSYNFMSLILDYFLAFSTSIICSLFRKQYYQNKASSLFYSMILFGLLRFICHFFSGVLISWTGDVSQLKPDFQIANVIYSLCYNISYLLPSTIISTIALLSISKALFTLNNSKMMKTLCPYNEEELETNSEHYLLYENILTFLYIILLIASILGSIPMINENTGISFNMYYLGYISLITIIIFDSITIYRIVKYKNKIVPIFNKLKTIKNIDTIYLLSSLVIIAVSILSIVSFYTYGYNTYH